MRDAASVSAFASDAMQWCVNNGIINGMDGPLNSVGQATRAQVSAMFARYIRLAAAEELLIARYKKWRGFTAAPIFAASRA